MLPQLPRPEYLQASNLNWNMCPSSAAYLWLCNIWFLVKCPLLFSLCADTALPGSGSHSISGGAGPAGMPACDAVPLRAAASLGCDHHAALCEPGHHQRCAHLHSTAGTCRHAPCSGLSSCDRLSSVWQQALQQLITALVGECDAVLFTVCMMRVNTSHVLCIILHNGVL